ncbi:hypothetical protein FLK61_32435 [Paenalkalicoccus suaedae]|uniref:Uncharacterized protein n=1 Tax=Paenalkalicoccus suaedae TaxID=2592382 RepID=A0A859FEW7_9BACI|nr:hypothetical protein [Paenalkalicoccus suaedae]QKS71410.1 hypothetical protein FLK61_32435 [Paenalkalicoccus suaedae]
MSIRAVEMQMIWPKSQQVGKINEQMQNRAMVMQDTIAQIEASKNAKKPHVVEQTEEAEQKRLANDDQESKGDSQQSSELVLLNEQEESETPQSMHPYKGRLFDAAW